MISYAKINLPFDVDAAQKEITSLELNYWMPHLNAAHYQGEWTVLALRSPGGNTANIVADLMQHDGYSDTPLMEQCNSIKKLLDGMHCEILSVRLLNLKKGAVIKEHRDAELAFEKGEARLHFPIFTNTDVEFAIDNETVIMRESECWYINANLNHRVANKGNADRIHLVIDCKVNDWLIELFERSEKKYARQEDDIEESEKIIVQLRTLGSETAQRIAKEMENKLSMNYGRS